MSGSVSVLNSLGRVVFGLGYEISPILLTGGTVSNFAGGLPSSISNALGGYLPIIALTEPINLLSGLINASLINGTYQWFAHYMPLPGATLIQNEIGSYPFANQVIAANAIIAQPLNVSLLMIAPVTGAGGYTTKLATFTLLKTYLDQHNQSGGTYTVATPAQIFPNLILKRLSDVTTGETKQVQIMWQWDFVSPLISLAEAEQLMNNQMQSITNGVQTTGATSGIAAAPPQITLTGIESL